MKTGASDPVVVVGGGAFGVAAALELRRRGHVVDLVDPGPLPRPEAASTDVSKAVRMDYGSDELYAELARRALEGWREWDRRSGQTLFHEVGILLLTPGAMGQDGFEGESFCLLRARGEPLERIDQGVLSRRWPAWRGAHYRDGYFNPRAGWVESGRAVERLLGEAREAGVRLREGASFARLSERGSRVTGVVLADGEELTSEFVIVAAGAWTPTLLPHLAGVLRATAQSVVHFEPPGPVRSAFDGERFPVWCADIANTGWYGFPVTADGALKIGNHGPGRAVHPDEPRVVSSDDLARFREFATATFPDLAGARVRSSRLCLYCDSFDGDFLIDHDPDRPGLVVASGGSGHGFKFAPVLGGIVADVLERRPNEEARRFVWRRAGPRATERARHDG